MRTFSTALFFFFFVVVVFLRLLRYTHFSCETRLRLVIAHTSCALPATTRARTHTLVHRLKLVVVLRLCCDPRAADCNESINQAKQLFASAFSKCFSPQIYTHNKIERMGPLLPSNLPLALLMNLISTHRGCILGLGEFLQLNLNEPSSFAR